eukprot:1851011-Amphidinium_carterae.3
MNTIGPDLDDGVQLLVLNRHIPDPRHAQILLEEAGLKDAKSKGVSTPREKLADATVSHDRADLAESAKTWHNICKRQGCSMQVWLREAQYLLQRPVAGCNFEVPSAALLWRCGVMQIGTAIQSRENRLPVAA